MSLERHRDTTRWRTIWCDEGQESGREYLLPRETRMGKLARRDKSWGVQDTGLSCQWLQYRMSISEWCKMRQDQALKRRLIFILKVTEIHGRVLSHQVENGVEEGHILDTLRHVRVSLVAPWWRKCLPMQEMWVWSLGWEDPLEKEMAIHSSILAWEFQGQRSLVNHRTWSPRVSQTWFRDETTTTKIG